MFTSEERIRLLSLVDIFEPLSAEEIEHLNGQLPDVHLKPGEIFYSPEDRSERLFVLWKGRGQDGAGGGEVENTQSSPPTESLPKGGDATREVRGEFSVNPATDSLSVSTNTCPGRYGFGAQPSLLYNLGVGDGAFGLAGASQCLPSPGKQTKNCRGRKLPMSRDLHFVWGRSPRAPCKWGSPWPN
jgi:hypothetical protein